MAELGATARAHDWRLLAIGAGCTAGGIYFVLVGLGLAPPPSKINGPAAAGHAE